MNREHLIFALKILFIVAFVVIIGVTSYVYENKRIKDQIAITELSENVVCMDGVQYYRNNITMTVLFNPDSTVKICSK